MRSYSTLLGHLIGSHPQVTGYAEQHRSYRSFVDLTELRYGIWKLSDYEVKGDYLFDKILHNKHIISDDVLERRDVLPIYGIREPISEPAQHRRDGAAGEEGQLAQRAPTRRVCTCSTDTPRSATCASDVRTAAALFTDSIVTTRSGRSPTSAAISASTHRSSPSTHRLPQDRCRRVRRPDGPDQGRAHRRRATRRTTWSPRRAGGRLIEDYRLTVRHCSRTSAPRCSVNRCELSTPAVDTTARLPSRLTPRSDFNA